MTLTALTRFCLGTRDRDFPHAEALAALNSAADSHRVQVGGLQILFWSDSREDGPFLGDALDAVSDHGSHRGSPAALSFLERLNAADFGAGGGAPDEGRFHVLGLSPSEPPVIRFWITDALLGLQARVKAFWEDLRFQSPGEPPALASVLQMIQEASFTEDFEQIAPRLTQDILTAMLSGSDFPPRLLQAVTEQIRADGLINRQRAVVLKALLARRARLSGGRRAAPDALDPEAPDPAYRFGRLFAVFNAIWELEGARAPSLLFRRLTPVAPALTALGLGRLARFRLTAAKAKNEPLAAVLAGEMDGLMDSLRGRFPRCLTAEDQARFALGLYQQRQALVWRFRNPHEIGP